MADARTHQSHSRFISINSLFGFSPQSGEYQPFATNLPKLFSFHFPGSPFLNGPRDNQTFSLSNAAELTGGFAQPPLLPTTLLRLTHPTSELPLTLSLLTCRDNLFF